MKYPSLLTFTNNTNYLPTEIGTRFNASTSTPIFAFPPFLGLGIGFQQLAKQIPDTAKMVVVRLERMQYLDQTGLYAMEDMLLDLKRKNIDLVFVNLMKQPRYMMERIDIIPDLISEDFIFEDFNTCLEWFKEHQEEINSRN